MTLTANQRDQTHRAYLRGGIVVDVLKAESRDAVGGLDDGLEAASGDLNAALPQPYRGAATPADKALLTAMVALRRSVAEGTYTKHEIVDAMRKMLDEMD